MNVQAQPLSFIGKIGADIAVESWVQGHSQGGRESVPPLMFLGSRRLNAQGPRLWRKQLKPSHDSHDIFAETEKKACWGSQGPSDNLGLPGKQDPCDYQGAL